MREDLEQRACELAQYMIENRTTVRAAAKRFGISKSTVHKDLTVRLKKRSRTLYESVARVLRTNKAERHLRGGEATRRRYAKGNDGASPQSGKLA